MSTRLIHILCITIALCSLGESLKCIICKASVNGDTCRYNDGKNFLAECTADQQVDPTKTMVCTKSYTASAAGTDVIRSCSNTLTPLGCVTTIGPDIGKLSIDCKCSDAGCNSVAGLKGVAMLALLAPFLSLAFS